LRVITSYLQPPTVVKGIFVSNLGRTILSISLVWIALGILSACGGGTGSKNSSGPGQFTHVYVVFPPSTSDPNHSHFMNTVINQPAIEGVTVATPWNQVETGTPGPGTCSPVGTDTCQLDASGWTHTYNWSNVDAANAVWFGAESGSKKMNLILTGISGASPNCLLINTCVNGITPAYVTASNWAAHTGSNNEDFINGNKDGCSNYVGLIASSMSRDTAGLVTVTEPNHGYSNGEMIWIGGTTPSTFNIAQEKITSVQVTSATSTLTITATNNLPLGTQVTFQNLGAATFLNGQTVTIASATPTSFTASYTHADYGPATENSGSANPLGVMVQNTTSTTFQYRTSVATAGSATTPGTVIGAQQSYPVPYEAPYKTGWEAFVAAAILHYNASPNLPQVSYMRVGRSVGGEAYPLCMNNMEQIPAPNTYTRAGWLQYYTDIDDFVQAQNPKMQILDPLNESGSGASADPSYGTDEAQIAVSYKNASGKTNGIGSQGLQSGDITNYASGQSCASDWCGAFNNYASKGIPLELQQAGLSAPVALTGTNSATGDLRPLLPFAVSRHMTVLELYYLDALLAYDPNYCVLPAVNGLCGPGSVQIPVIALPPQDQLPYFQAVGQPGQTSATGDGSYAAVINSTEGQH
jgi:hypothetical protein